LQPCVVRLAGIDLCRFAIRYGGAPCAFAVLVEFRVQNRDRGATIRDVNRRARAGVNAIDLAVEGSADLTIVHDCPVHDKRFVGFDLNIKDLVLAVNRFNTTNPQALHVFPCAIE